MEIQLNLYLCYNKFTSLDSQVFGGFDNLLELRIANNLISSIASTTFQSLNSLQTLDLSEKFFDQYISIHVLWAAMSNSLGLE